MYSADLEFREPEQCMEMYYFPNGNKPETARRTTNKDRLEKLRDLIEFDKDLSLYFETDETTLLKFLYSRYLNVNDTFELIKNYYQYRKINRELFENFSIEDSEVRTALENSLPGLLPYKDRKCQCILIFHANNWDCSYSLLSIYKAMLCCLEYALNDVHNQNNGFAIIVDWEQFTFAKTVHLTPNHLSLMIEGLQNCFPAKFKEIHFVAPPWYISTALTFIKRSFTEDVKENFFVHGRNLNTLHEHFHKDVLPSELGGTKPSYNPQRLIRLMEENCNTGKLS